MSILNFRTQTLVCAIVLPFSWEASFVAQASATTAEAAEASPAAPAASTLDKIQVKAQRVNAAVQKKSKENVVVDSVIYDDAEATAINDSAATMLGEVPGVSLEKDSDQPRYVTVRGIQADLNATTIDGISMASVGDTGSGTRRVNLQLLPSEMSSRIDVYKTFTAAQDSGAIGAAIDVISRSAFDVGRRYFFADVYGIKDTQQNDNGHNSIKGNNDGNGAGAKLNFSDVFGSDSQFGFVFSGRYQYKPGNAEKAYQSTKYYFSDAGKKLDGPDVAAGWNGQPAPYDFTYYDDNIIYRTYGGSAKFEWKPVDSGIYSSLMLYDYTQVQQSTENGYNITGASTLKDQTSDGGTQQVKYLNTYLTYNDRKRDNRGAIATFNWTGDRSRFSLRGGYTRELLNWWQPYMKAYAKVSGTNYVDYANGGTYDLPYVTDLSDPSIIEDSSYKLSTLYVTNMRAREGVGNLKLDYAFNADPGDLGLGFATGAELRKLDIWKDQDETDYSTGNIKFNNYFYVPGYRYPQAAYAYPFIDYDKFIANGGYSNFSVNQADTAFNSGSADYRYKETMRDLYLSLYYQTERSTTIVGVRHDDVSYTGFTPAIEGEVLTGTTDVNNGHYRFYLPSFNFTYRLNDMTNVHLSASKTLGRPNPSDIATAEDRNCSSDDDAGTANCTITKGNASLKPRQSKNYDVSIDHYFHDGRGMLSLAYFRKQIKDDIVTVAKDETIDGVDYTVKSPQNLDQSSLEGAEFSYLDKNLQWGGQRVDVAFNVTKMHGKMTYTNDSGSRDIHRLLYQPNWVANASVGWYLRPVDAKLTVSANYTGNFMRVIGDDPWDDQGRRHYTDVDVSLKKNLGPHMSVRLDAGNVLGQKIAFTTGEDLQYTRNVDSYGRTFYLHFTYTL